MYKRKIVVCGATGNQGRSVIRSLLLHSEWNVVALTRDPTSLTSIALVNLGAEVVFANTRDQASLFTAFQDAYGVFGITQSWSAEDGGYNIQSEIIQGKNIIWAAKSAGVKHIVFSSFINLHNEVTGVSFIDSKLLLEGQIKQQNLPVTIVRCALYMENLEQQINSAKTNIIRGNFPAYAKIPYIALEDIGNCVAYIFDHPEKYRSKTVNLIGDFVSGMEVADELNKISESTSFVFSPASKLMLWLSNPPIYRLRQYFEQFGYPPFASGMLKAIENSKKDFKTMNIKSFLENCKSIGKT
jgi:uncharacterized protein YbjT (DUF2867 family)